MSETRKERRLRKLREAFGIALLTWEPINTDTEKEALLSNAIASGLRDGLKIAEFVIRSEE